MRRLMHVLWMLILFEMGVILLFLPWLDAWQNNYFLTHYPQLTILLLNPSLRGVVSGVGALDILLAARMLRPRPGNKPGRSADFPLRERNSATTKN